LSSSTIYSGVGLSIINMNSTESTLKNLIVDGSRESFNTLNPEDGVWTYGVNVSGERNTLENIRVFDVFGIGYIDRGINNLHEVINVSDSASNSSGNYYSNIKIDEATNGTWNSVYSWASEDNLVDSAFEMTAGISNTINSLNAQNTTVGIYIHTDGSGTL